MRSARWLPLLALATLACAGSTTDPTPDDDTIATVAIAPGDLDFDALQVTAPLTATARTAAGDPVLTTFTWSVKGTGVAQVSSTGVVTAVGNGVDSVFVLAGGKVAKVEVRVEQVATGVAITGAAPVFAVSGQTAQLNASLVDRNNRPVSGLTATWTSSNPAVVHVSPTGVATAVGPGTATITAASGAATVQVAGSVTLTSPVGGARVGVEHPCTGGMSAGTFPCQNVTLLSFLPLGGVGASGNVDLNDIWGWVDPVDQKEYVAVMRRDGTAFVDVSNPLHPRYLGHLPITPGANPNTWHDVKLYQNHAFIVADGAGAHGMQVFDMTRLRGVTVPQQFTPDFTYTQINSAHNIFINEATGFAYSVGGSSGGTTCGGGLHMINIQNPKAPVFAGCFAYAGTGRVNTGYTHDVQCVVYAGPDAAHTGREICFGSNETHLAISDVTNKQAPIAISRTSYPAVSYTHQGWLTPDQRYFFINDELDELGGSVQGTRTLVWDVSDIDDPVLVNQYIGPTPATDHNHYIRGNRMFMSNYQYGLRVVDVSNPLAPALVGHFDTSPNLPDVPGFGGTWSNYPFFPSGIIVMTSRTEGLYVLRAN